MNFLWFSLLWFLKEFFDCIVLPGGLGGANAMSQSKELGDLLKKYEHHGKLIAAICAGKFYFKLKIDGFGVRFPVLFKLYNFWCSLERAI